MFKFCTLFGMDCPYLTERKTLINKKGQRGGLITKSPTVIMQVL